jgi:hypothetical protein
MASNEKHHYVPRFYLNGWVTPDGEAQARRLTRFQWKGGRFLVERVVPRSTACLDRLYSLEGVPVHDQQRIETEFLAKIIDHPAGDVLHHMRTAGPGHDLVQSQRIAWTRFLMSLRIRSPEIMAQLNSDASSELRKHLTDVPDEYEEIKGEGDPETLLEFVEREAPGFIEDFGKRMLPGLIMDDKAFKKIHQMNWWTADFSTSKATLLTSDHPIIIMPGLDHPGCVLALPISPTLVFFACPDERVVQFLLHWKQELLVEWLNATIVRLAFEQVYAVDSRQEEFVRRRLNRLSRDD